MHAAKHRDEGCAVTGFAPEKFTSAHDGVHTDESRATEASIAIRVLENGIGQARLSSAEAMARQQQRALRLRWSALNESAKSLRAVHALWLDTDFGFRARSGFLRCLDAS
jgi:hypothetical protein